MEQFNLNSDLIDLEDYLAMTASAVTEELLELEYTRQFTNIVEIDVFENRYHDFS